jgi:hypothetical protein
MTQCSFLNHNGRLRCSLKRFHAGPHNFVDYSVKEPDGKVITDATGREIRVHGRYVCEPEGFPCVIHDPSAHKMRDWPMIIRLDKMALVERQCEHGVGHPDIDSVLYLARKLGDTFKYYSLWSHGCDGCCR